MPRVVLPTLDPSTVHRDVKKSLEDVAGAVNDLHGSLQGALAQIGTKSGVQDVSALHTRLTALEQQLAAVQIQVNGLLNP